MGFLTVEEGLKEAKKELIESLMRSIPYGIRFLDDALNGIAPDDLVVCTSDTGIGKTQLALIIAAANAFAGNRVAFFALEATAGELHKRLLYQEIAHLYYASPRTETITFRDFLSGERMDVFSKYMPMAEKMIELKYKHLHIFTRKGVPDLTARNFIEQAKSAVANFGVEFIILDHFHFLNFEGGGEDNSSLSESMKDILNFVKIDKIPTICICHFRKRSGFKDQRMMLSLDDIHGTSNIAKMATVVITAARSREAAANSKEIPTFFKILKSRNYGNLMGVTALTRFDISTGLYQDTYQLGKFDGEDSFEPSPLCDIPNWAIDSTIEHKKKEPNNYYQQNVDFLKERHERQICDSAGAKE